MPIDRDKLKESTTEIDGCWVWIRGRSQFGYGYLRIGNRIVGAHRASYEAFIEPIPSGLRVCHKCDNPSCINPDHLFLGTSGDNLNDWMVKYYDPSMRSSMRRI
jgi:HNH endonuclease